MINELLKDFRKTKLTSEDLNLYKITLNKTYSNSLENADVFLKSKIAYSNNEATREEVDQNKTAYKIAKKELKEVQSTKAFLANFKNAKHLLRKVEKSKDLKFQEEAVIEFKEAKKLLTEFKFVAKEYGRGASLEKNSEYAIEVSNLKFRYNPEYPLALNDVSFKISAGEYIAIVGHNGSGKSTLSKVLIGVLNPEAGSYKIFGNTIAPSNLDQARKFLGIVFQNPDNQFIGSTVQADIAFGLENKRVEPTKMPDMIHNAAKAVRMEEFLDHEPLNLSGGQKQRVAIASALALNPDILIFDEATSMLDPRGKREIKEIMVNLRKKQNKTILSITHDMDEILNADKVIVMNGGQMVRMGTPEEVLKDKDFLRSIQLDIPFVGLVEEALNEVGVKIGHTNNMDELVEQICK